MSGPENIRGIDYQMSVTSLLVLHALVNEAAPLESVRIDSLDDEGEDLVLNFSDGHRRQIQLKKLTEGYNWTPSRLKPILSRFANYDDNVECLFVTDGSIGNDASLLRPFLEGQCQISSELSDSLLDSTLTVESLNSLVGRTRLATRFYPSTDPDNPAALVKQEVEHFLVRGPFSLGAPATIVASSLWRLFFDAARNGEEIGSATLLDRFREARLAISTEIWAKYPTVAAYYPHSHSTGEVSSLLFSSALLLITGIGGTGKTSLLAESAALAAQRGQRTCWLSVSELLEPSDAIELIADYCRSTGLVDLASKLRNLHSYEYVMVLAKALADWPVSIVFDRFEAAGARLTNLVRDVILSLPENDRKGSVTLLNFRSWSQTYNML